MQRLYMQGHILQADKYFVYYTMSASTAAKFQGFTVQLCLCPLKNIYITAVPIKTELGRIILQVEIYLGRIFCL